MARQRLPHWADRIAIGNAIDWTPERRFDLVRTGLEYVPRGLRPELLRHLFDATVAPGGRLIYRCAQGSRRLGATAKGRSLQLGFSHSRRGRGAACAGLSRRAPRILAREASGMTAIAGSWCSARRSRPPRARLQRETTKWGCRHLQ